MDARATPSQRTAFRRFCAERTGRRFGDDAAFHAFSVAEYRRFWLLFLEWSDLIYEGVPEPVCTHDSCEHATFFPELRLSYAENLLRIDTPEDGERPALVAHRADGPSEQLTRRELRRRVRVLAAELAQLGVSPGERVVAVASNNPEAIVGALAAATIGATFSIATPDMGVPALLSRFEQLEPVVLMANLENRAETGSSTLRDHVGALAAALGSLKVIVALDDGAAPAVGVPLLRLSEVLAAGDDDDREWPRFSFNHPLFVLFTSGTTGRPKCIVHGAGGTLLEHAKEHRLHVDLRPADTLFFHTSTAWMMWNWQLSALACGSPIVLFDGSFTEPQTLWELVERHDVSVFGASPPYLQLCQDSGASPGGSLGLGALRSVLSTGSILHDWQYDWVREHVGPVALQSISGGTDIIGCFVLGNPDLPIRRGMIQCASLGLDVAAVAPSGEAVGELICRNPFPSRPLGFVADDGTRFHSTYFERNPGVWTHGDLIEFDADGYARMHGRSDGVLKVQGVRIGPAEIQIALRDVAEVRDVLAVQQQTPGVRGDSRVVLLVVLREGATLDGALLLRIRREIARCASPLHVPELIVAVDELPTTHSGKRSERAARDAVDGRPVGNVEALRNPGSLEGIRRALAETEQRLSTLAQAPEDTAGQPTEARLRAIWESVLGVTSLGADDNFFDVGGSSLAAVRVFELIYERLGVDLPLSTLLHAPTTNALAELIDAPGELRVPSIVPLAPGADGPPLFMLPGWHGDVLRLRALALHLATDRPIYGVQGGLTDPSLPPQERIGALAERYLQAIRSAQPAGPYALVGHSFGGFLAFDIARRLDALNERVELLGILDTAVHHRWLTPRDRAGFLILRPFRYARTTLRSPRRVLAPYARSFAARVGLGVADPPAPLLMRERLATGLEAWAAYRPQPYPGTVTLFRAKERDGTIADAQTIWREVARGGLAIEQVRGGHNEMLVEPNVEVLAERLSAWLTDGAGAVREDQVPALRAELPRRRATTV